MKQAVANRATRWGRLADMRRWNGDTSGVQALFRNFADWTKTTHCKASVQVLSDYPLDTRGLLGLLIAGDASDLN